MEFGCINHATHRIHLCLNRIVGLQVNSGIQYGIFRQHIACFQTDSRLLQFRYQRRSHTEVHALGIEVDACPVHLRFAWCGIRYLHLGVCLTQVGNHRIHGVVKICQSQVGIDLALAQIHLGQVSQFDTCSGSTFRTAGKLHIFRQEVRKVREVGIECKLQVDEHVAEQVVNLTFG